MTNTMVNNNKINREEALREEALAQFKLESVKVHQPVLYSGIQGIAHAYSYVALLSQYEQLRNSLSFKGKCSMRKDLKKQKRMLFKTLKAAENGSSLDELEHSFVTLSSYLSSSEEEYSNLVKALLKNQAFNMWLD